MTWADFYLFCFAFGFFFSVVTVLSGHLHFGFDGHGHAGDLGHFGHGHGHLGHVDAGGHGHSHVHVDAGENQNGRGGTVSPFNLGTMAAFLAWFGGTGYLTTRFYHMWFVTTLVMSVIGGTAGGWLVYLFLSKVLMRSQEQLDPADYDMIGVLGRVSGTIRSGGIGEILFSQEGSRRSAPARSEDSAVIPKGTEVVVTRYEDGIAYVRRWDELASGADAQITGA